MGFGERKFLEAAHEIDNVTLDGFEFLTESKKESVECKIYRKYEEVGYMFIYSQTPVKSLVTLKYLIYCINLRVAWHILH